MVSGTQMLEFAQQHIIAAEDSELPTISHHQKNQHMPVKQNPLVICNQQTIATESEIQLNFTSSMSLILPSRTSYLSSRRTLLAWISLQLQ